GILTSASALLLASAAFVAYDVKSFYDDVVRGAKTQARIIGYNSAATILFTDPHSATETLAALSTEPDIIAAGIYTRDGRLFAGYTARGSSATAGAQLPKVVAQRSDGYQFQGSYLELWQQIVFERKVIGTIVIQTSLDDMRVRLLQYIAIALLVLLISTLGSIVVSLWFQRKISRPILDLAMTAKSVTRDKDFSVRAPPTDSADEIGQLIETFNEMLARIQEQNRELQMSRDDLEQRVVERTAQLESANKELEAFSYSVSHDLRAPLRSIDGFSQALLEDYQDKLDDEGQNHLQRVRAATQRMAQLIDDMLDLSRVTRAEINREPIDLSALARSLPAELQKADPGREVEFVIADGLVANGDARLLRIVLENLFRNAWKFTGKHPTAKIEFAVTQNNGKSAYYVRDDGAGFDMAYANKLFGAFQRLHAMSEFNGTGIGLATVQRIIRRHGGQVWAEGEVEKGATFYFTL
ncbi:MAG TPA: ATP-binding protein, partial [Candidatus Binatia bacterium]